MKRVTFFFNLIFTTSSPNAGWFTRLISWLFMYFTRGIVSHTAGVFDIYGMRMTVGAESDGVSWIPLKKFTEKNRIVCSLVPKVNYDKLKPAFVKLMKEYSDAKYDYRSVGVGFLKYVLSLPVKWLKKLLSKREVNCTELYIKYLQYADFNCVRYLDPKLSSAPDLMNMCLRSNEFDIVFYYKRK